MIKVKEVKRINESKEPSRGIFWFVKTDEQDDYDILYLDIPESIEIQGNSRNGLTYTHQLTWDELADNQPRDIKDKSWNYFPRGRVDLRNNKAMVFLNPNINTPENQSMIKDAFNLNNIKCRFVSDGSDHYKSYLD